LHIIDGNPVPELCTCNPPLPNKRALRLHLTDSPGHHRSSYSSGHDEPGARHGTQRLPEAPWSYLLRPGVDPATPTQGGGGKSEYIKSLKTGDLNEANKRKHPYIAAFKARIAALERQKAAAQAPAELAELYEKALSWRLTLVFFHREPTLVEQD
jgi:hypothetical protein